MCTSCRTPLAPAEPRRDSWVSLTLFFPLLIFSPVRMGKFTQKISAQYWPKAFFSSSEMYFCNSHSLHWELSHYFHVAKLPQLQSLQNLCSQTLAPHLALLFEVARWERGKWQLLGHMQTISRYANLSLNNLHVL